MPTPAENVHTTVKRQEVVNIFPSGGASYTNVLGNRNVGWIDRVRPASGAANRISGTPFKLCREWTHEVRDIRYTGAACQSTYVIGSSKTLYVYPEGSYWSGNRTPPTPTAISTNLINSCLVEALNKLKHQDFHLGNFVAEGRKTVEMIGSHTTFIARQVEAYRQGNPAKWKLVQAYEKGNLPRHLWCKIPSDWLQLQYGWKPLMSDVFGAAAHLGGRSRFDLPWASVKAHKRDKTGFSSSLAGANAGVSNTFWEQKDDVWVSLVYGVIHPVLAELSSLGLINPAEIIWETLRYSFVVDWFLPIGSWLSALTGNLGYGFITGSISGKSILSPVGNSVVPPNNTSLAYHTVHPGLYSGTHVVFARRCYKSSPVPGLYVKSPISLDHMLNGLALLAQAFRN